MTISMNPKTIRGWSQSSSNMECRSLMNKENPSSRTLLQVHYSGVCGSFSLGSGQATPPTCFAAPPIIKLQGLKETRWGNGLVGAWADTVTYSFIANLQRRGSLSLGLGHATPPMCFAPPP